MKLKRNDAVDVEDLLLDVLVLLHCMRKIGFETINDFMNYRTIILRWQIRITSDSGDIRVL